MRGGEGHICELQIALKSLVVAQSGMNTHEAHALAQYFVEMLLKAGRKCDATKTEELLQKENAALKAEVTESKLGTPISRRTLWTQAPGPRLASSKSAT